MGLGHFTGTGRIERGADQTPGIGQHTGAVIAHPGAVAFVVHRGIFQTGNGVHAVLVRLTGIFQERILGTDRIGIGDTLVDAAFDQI